MEHIPVHKAEHTTAAKAVSPTGHQGKQPKRGLRIALLVGGGILVLLMAAGWGLYQSSARAYIDASKYQAVFFTNGQVYFGKLHQLGGGYFKLDDIFYIQAKQAESKEGSKNPQETSNEQATDIQLIKLGSEVHGPDDEMIISESQILFFENLKKDGKVTESIAKYQSQKK